MYISFSSCITSERTTSSDSLREFVDVRPFPFAEDLSRVAEVAEVEGGSRMIGCSLDSPIRVLFPRAVVEELFARLRRLPALEGRSIVGEAGDNSISSGERTSSRESDVALAVEVAGLGGAFELSADGSKYPGFDGVFAFAAELLPNLNR